MAGSAALLFLGGCSSKRVMMENGPITDERGSGDTNLLVLPYQSLGVKITPALQEGAVTVFEGPLPDSVMGEEYPGRIRYNGLAVNEDNDKEFFVQFVRIGIYKTGEFMYAIIIEGERSELTPNTKVVELSSVGEFVSNLSGGTYQIEKEKLEGKAYRLEIVRKYGSKIGARREIFGFAGVVKAWNIYDFEKEGKIFSPYGVEDIKRIKRINPGYTPLEKMIADGHATLSTNPVYTVASIALTVFEGMNASSKGWDYSSELANRHLMGAIINYVGQLRLALLRELNAENEQLKKERDEALKGKRR